MLHYTSDHDIHAVTQAIHVQLECPLEKLIEQNTWTALNRAVNLRQVGFEFGLASDHPHGATTEDITWACHQWIAKLCRKIECLKWIICHHAFGLGNTQPFAELIKLEPVLGFVNRAR